MIDIEVSKIYKPEFTEPQLKAVHQVLQESKRNGSLPEPAEAVLSALDDVFKEWNHKR